jgi:3-dehydroquinate synthetase
MVVVTDEPVGELYLPSLGTVDLEVVLPAALGPGRKSLRAVEHVYDTLLDHGIDRTATIVSLGTSVVGDIAGFVAATYLRGVDLVHCPTNLIAMVDTSIGGKVGLDRPHGRNLIGLYKQPRAVVADVATLQTLPARERAAGMAEVVKHGLIAGSDLLAQIEAEEWTAVDNALPGTLGRLQALVAQAIQVKIAIVEEDPFESGRRAQLHLGHTFAYAIEHATGGTVNHGEAVGLGLIAAARLSEATGLAEPGLGLGLAEHVARLVAHVGLPTHLPDPIPPDVLLAAMRHDKKRVAGRQTFVLLRAPGHACLTTDVPPALIPPVLATLNP